MMLNNTEIRVLGVLIEKSLTHPNSYPLTLNAIVLGANQKQNREPVFELTEGEVATAVYSLQQMELVDCAATAPGARANRFEHKVVERCHWDRRDQAVMAELMLRDRQTAGELRTRGARMTPIPDLEAVNAIIRGLMDREPPIVAELPREPGRSTNRFCHLLTGQDASTAIPTTSEVAPSETRSADAPVHAQSGSAAGAGDPDLTRRVETLERQLALLTGAVEELKKNAGAVVDRHDASPL